MRKTGDNKGFTIIETVIVLAIASLILVAVLAGVSQLRRNQRNSARKADVQQLIFAVKECITLNRNASRCKDTERIRLNPESAFSIFEDFTVKTFEEGGDSSLSYIDIQEGNAPREINNVIDNMPIIWIGFQCDPVGSTPGGIVEGDSKDDFAINYPQEGSGGTWGLYDNRNGFCTDSDFENLKT
ncbi:MAG: prepilin-type N-terminal cleavage/methylation domain-containing protein [Candidatus Saccharimonadales bacterium]|jgi:prepilin-type N-terminal cleavage/methylation domain-containing protein